MSSETTNGQKERSDTRKWCSLHKSTIHSDTECEAQKGKEDTNTPPQGEINSAHTMTGSTPKEEGFRLCFCDAITSLTVGNECFAQASACPTHRHVDEPQRFLLLALTIFVGAWGLFYKGF